LSSKKNKKGHLKKKIYGPYRRRRRKQVHHIDGISPSFKVSSKDNGWKSGWLVGRLVGGGGGR
jgi:hypothetical protein